MTGEPAVAFHLSKHHTSLVLVCLGALGLIFVLHSSEPEILSSVEADTEYLSFTVLDPDRAAFYVPKAKLVGQDSKNRPTVSGLFVAAFGSTIIYRRNSNDGFTIEVDAPEDKAGSPAGSLEVATTTNQTDSGGETRQFKGRVGFEFDKQETLPRFPIWGRMTLGQEFSPPARPRPPEARLLLHGKLTVSGVSGGSHGSVLYPITTVDLPIGARIETAAELDGKPGPIWWGTVSIKPDQPYLTISAVSQSRRIALYRPGKPDADQIEVSVTDKLTQDPRLVSLQLYIVAVLGFAVGLVTLGEPIHELVSWLRRRLGTVALVAGLLAGAPAHAQIVRLTLGDNTFGQGWLFWDTDARCKVVTARHVLASSTGELLTPRVIDSRDVEHETGPAILDSPDYDVAVLPVIAGNPAQVCNDGRLSTIGIERRLRTASRLVIDTTGRTDIRHVPANLGAANRDLAGGEFFLVRLDGVTEEASEGWSGSAVLDADGPIGLVQRLAPDSRRDLIALRMDIVRRLMQAAPPAVTAAPSAKPIVDLTKGSTVVSPVRGGGQALLDGTGIWRIRPSAGRIDFSLTFAKPVDLRGAVLTFGAQSAKSVKGAGLETVGDLAYPDAVGDRPYQRRIGEQAAYTFHVAPRTIRQIRFSVGTEGNESIDLTNLQLF